MRNAPQAERKGYEMRKLSFLVRRNVETGGRKRTTVHLKLTPTFYHPVAVMAKPYLETFSYDVRITGEAFTIAGKIGHNEVKQRIIDACVKWERENAPAIKK